MGQIQTLVNHTQNNYIPVALSGWIFRNASSMGNAPSPTEIPQVDWISSKPSHSASLGVTISTLWVAALASASSSSNLLTTIVNEGQVPVDNRDAHSIFLPDRPICGLAELASASALVSQLCQQNGQRLRSHLEHCGLFSTLLLGCKLLWQPKARDKTPKRLGSRSKSAKCMTHIGLGLVL